MNNYHLYSHISVKLLYCIRSYFYKQHFLVGLQQTKNSKWWVQRGLTTLMRKLQVAVLSVWQLRITIQLMIEIWECNSGIFAKYLRLSKQLYLRIPCMLIYIRT